MMCRLSRYGMDFHFTSVPGAVTMASPYFFLSMSLGSIVRSVLKSPCDLIQG